MMGARIPPPRRALVLGIPVDAVAIGDAAARILGWVAAQRAAAEETPPAAGAAYTRHVVTLNPELLMRARRDPRFRALILAADLVVADGMGIVWAARLLGDPLPGRVAGVDLMTALADRAARDGTRLFLLGSAPGVAEAAAAALRQRFPRLLVAGVYAGSPRPVDEEEAVRRIRAARAELVFVAYGAPAQEEWIARTRGRLGAVAAIGVGGAFDFLSGRVPRAPRWMRRGGVEWLYRLAREPWRWRRMLALPRFAAAVGMAWCVPRIRRMRAAGR